MSRVQDLVDAFAPGGRLTEKFLRNDVVGAGFQSGGDVLGAVPVTEQGDRQARQPFVRTHALAQIDPAKSRQIQIEEQQVWKAWLRLTGRRITRIQIVPGALGVGPAHNLGPRLLTELANDDGNLRRI